NAPLRNIGVTITALGAGNQINGAYDAEGTNPLIRVLGKNLCPEGCGDADLNFGNPAGFTNGGLIELTSQDSDWAASVGATATFINSGTLSILDGMGGDRKIRAQLDNRGMVTVERDTSLEILDGADQLNNATGVLDATNGSITVSGSATFT